MVFIQGWVIQCFLYFHKVPTFTKKGTIEVERFVYETDFFSSFLVVGGVAVTLKVSVLV